MRLPCTMKAARVGGVAKAWYLDDQSRVCCALPCASSPCPFHSACGRIINNRIPLCEDTHTSHYCSRCYESMHSPCADALPCALTARLSFRRASQCTLFFSFSCLLGTVFCKALALFCNPSLYLCSLHSALALLMTAPYAADARKQA